MIHRKYKKIYIAKFLNLQSINQSILLFKWHALKMPGHVSWLMSHCGCESVGGVTSKEKVEVKCDIKKLQRNLNIL